jgi:hypothetical protein
MPIARARAIAWTLLSQPLMAGSALEKTEPGCQSTCRMPVDGNTVEPCRGHLSRISAAAPMAGSAWLAQTARQAPFAISPEVPALARRKTMHQWHPCRLAPAVRMVPAARGWWSLIKAHRTRVHEEECMSGSLARRGRAAVYDTVERLKCLRGGSRCCRWLSIRRIAR